MKTIKKLVIAVVLVLILLIGGAVTVVWMSINPIARGIVQKGSKDALTVQADMKDFSLSLLSGNLVVNDFDVDNVPDYQSQKIITLKKLDTSVDTGSLLSDTIVVKNFHMDGLTVNIDQNEKGLNVQELLKRMKEKSAEAGEGEDAPKKEDDSGKKVKVDVIKVTNLKANFRLLGKDDPIVIPIKEFEIKDVDQGNAQGLAIEELIDQIFPIMLATIMEEANGVVADEIIKGITGDLSAFAGSINLDLDSQMAGIQDQFKGLAESAENLKQMGDQAEKLGEEADKLKEQGENLINNLPGLGN